MQQYPHTMQRYALKNNVIRIYVYKFMYNTHVQKIQERIQIFHSEMKYLKMISENSLNRNQKTELEYSELLFYNYFSVLTFLPMHVL